MQLKLKDFGFDSDLLIGRKIRYYEHIGCGGTLLCCVTTKREIVENYFNGDYEAFQNYLNFVGVDITKAWFCNRCLRVIESVEVTTEHGITWIPNPKKARLVEKFSYIPYEKHIEIVKRAYSKVQKYKDGKSTRDTWLASTIARILKDEGLCVKNVPEHGVRLKLVGLPVVDWAIRKGFFVVTKTVDYDVPYAYRKHGWRGIKSTISWRVIKPTKSFEELLQHY